MNNHTERTSDTETPLVNVTAQIPRGSEAAFQKIAAAWREALVQTRVAPPATAPASTSSGPQDLLQAATEWWSSLNGNERAIWSLWIEAAPELVPASRIVSELGLKNSGSIKGVINRMVRKGAAVGFQVGWQSDKTDPLTREKLYGVRDFGTGEFDYDCIQMTGVEYARLLRNARAAAEQ